MRRLNLRGFLSGTEGGDFWAVPWSSFRPRETAAIIMACGFVVAVVSYVGSYHHPDVAPPVGVQAESEVVEALQTSKERDGRLIGDLVVERFYAIDLETGQRIVADLCRGRIEGVTTKLKYDWTEYTYAVQLDRTGLQAELAHIAAFVAEAVPPEIGDRVKYAGMRVQPGTEEEIQINYDGLLPDEFVGFEGPMGEDEFAYLSSQTYSTLTRLGPQLLDIEGNRYLLTNTDIFPGFRDLFGVRRAVILAQLLLVDATSAPFDAVPSTAQ